MLSLGLCRQGIVRTEATRVPTEPETAETLPGPTSQRRAQDDDGDTEAGEPRCKRGRTTASAMPLGHGRLATEDLVGENERCANLREIVLSLCSQVHRFDWTSVGGAEDAPRVHLRKNDKAASHHNVQVLNKHTTKKRLGMRAILSPASHRMHRGELDHDSASLDISPPPLRALRTRNHLFLPAHRKQPTQLKREAQHALSRSFGDSSQGPKVRFMFKCFRP